jgi:chromosome segregation ATPase
MKIGFKEIIIIALGVALGLSLIFRPSKDIDVYEGKINDLKKQNKLLLNSNDSLMSENVVLSQEITDILIKVDSNEAKIAITETKLSDLKNEKDNVNGRVRVLDADGIASELTDYLNK